MKINPSIVSFSGRRELVKSNLGQVSFKGRPEGTSVMDSTDLLDGAASDASSSGSTKSTGISGKSGVYGLLSQAGELVSGWVWPASTPEQVTPTVDIPKVLSKSALAEVDKKPIGLDELSKHFKEKGLRFDDYLDILGTKLKKEPYARKQLDKMLAGMLKGEGEHKQLVVPGYEDINDVTKVINKITGTDNAVRVLSKEDYKKETEVEIKKSREGIAKRQQELKSLSIDEANGIIVDMDKKFQEPQDPPKTNPVLKVKIKDSKGEDQFIIIDREKLKETKEALDKKPQFKFAGEAFDMLIKGVENYDKVVSGNFSGWVSDMVANGLGVASGFAAALTNVILGIGIVIINSCNLYARTAGSQREGAVTDQKLASTIGDFKEDIHVAGSAALLLLAIANGNITGTKLYDSIDERRQFEKFDVANGSEQSTNSASTSENMADSAASMEPLSRLSVGFGGKSVADSTISLV